MKAKFSNSRGKTSPIFNPYSSPRSPKTLVTNNWLTLIDATGVLPNDDKTRDAMRHSLPFLKKHLQVGRGNEITRVQQHHGPPLNPRLSSHPSTVPSHPSDLSPTSHPSTIPNSKTGTAIAPYSANAEARVPSAN